MTSPPGPLSPLPPSHSPGEGERGYNLVMLMVLVTLLNVALAASLPLWSHVIQRDKEEELIARGFQYAEAIRVFQNRFQRPPIRLEELIEVKPRSIRRLWTDPMTENGKWAIIPVGTGDPLTPQPDPNQGGPNGRGGENTEEGEEDSPFGAKKGEEVMVGPIRGVHSRSSKKSILIFNGRERYDEWHFTMEMILGQMGGGGGAGGQPPPPQVGQQQMAGGLPNLSTRWLGRPFPAFIQPPQVPIPQGPGGDPTTLDPRKPGPGRNPPPGRPSPSEDQ